MVQITMTPLKCFAFFSIVTLFFLFVAYPIYQIGREWYCLKHYGWYLYRGSGLEEHEPMGINLLPEQVLLFIDDQGQFGYIYFNSRIYGRADYTLVLYKDGDSIMQNEHLSFWRYLPWQRISDHGIYPACENKDFAYFFINEFGHLGFNGTISNVALTTLADIQDGIDTNNVQWVKTGTPFY